MTPNQVREINAYTNIENELIDDACGRVFAWLKAQDMFDNTDIFFTTDHGELQGDFGLMFKGPYHVDALMRLPFIWRPAKAANVAPAEVLEPVGHLDLAATFCAIAGVEPPSYNEGKALPVHNEEAKTSGARLCVNRVGFRARTCGYAPSKYLSSRRLAVYALRQEFYVRRHRG